MPNHGGINGVTGGQLAALGNAVNGLVLLDRRSALSNGGSNLALRQRSSFNNGGKDFPPSGRRSALRNGGNNLALGKPSSSINGGNRSQSLGLLPTRNNDNPFTLNMPSSTLSEVPTMSHRTRPEFATLPTQSMPPPARTTPLENSGSEEVMRPAMQEQPALANVANALCPLRYQASDTPSQYLHIVPVVPSQNQSAATPLQYPQTIAVIPSQYPPADAVLSSQYNPTAMTTPSRSFASIPPGEDPFADVSPETGRNPERIARMDSSSFLFSDTTDIDIQAGAAAFARLPTYSSAMSPANPISAGPSRQDQQPQCPQPQRFHPWNGGSLAQHQQLQLQQQQSQGQRSQGQHSTLTPSQVTPFDTPHTSAAPGAYIPLLRPGDLLTHTRYAVIPLPDRERINTHITRLHAVVDTGCSPGSRKLAASHIQDNSVKIFNYLHAQDVAEEKKAIEYAKCLTDTPGKEFTTPKRIRRTLKKILTTPQSPADWEADWDDTERISLGQVAGQYNTLPRMRAGTPIASPFKPQHPALPQLSDELREYIQGHFRTLQDAVKLMLTKGVEGEKREEASTWVFKFKKTLPRVGQKYVEVLLAMGEEEMEGVVREWGL
jgi:hypothetical protein